MESPASNSETINVSQTQTLLNVNMTNVTKLTASNILMWSRQVPALLDGYDLSGYITGSIVIPPSTNTIDGVTTPTSEYTLWKRKDRLIYSALLGAITVTIQLILSTTTTSYLIWETLSTIYAKPSRAHVKQIRQQLKTWTKGTMTIDAYLQGFVTRFDQLALLGKPIEIEDQHEYVMEGLPDEYKQIVDQIEGRDTVPSISELHEKLLNYKVKLQSKTVATATTPIMANVANYRGSNQRNNNHNNNNFQCQNRSNDNHSQHQTWQQQQFSAPGGQPPCGYQGLCQFCGVQGHSARRCPQLQNVASSAQSSRQFTPNARSWNLELMLRSLSHTTPTIGSSTVELHTISPLISPTCQFTSCIHVERK